MAYPTKNEPEKRKLYWKAFRIKFFIRAFNALAFVVVFGILISDLDLWWLFFLIGVAIIIFVDRSLLKILKKAALEK